MYEVRSDFVILRTKFAKTVVPHNFVMFCHYQYGLAWFADVFG